MVKTAAILFVVYTILVLSWLRANWPYALAFAITVLAAWITAPYGFVRK